MKCIIFVLLLVGTFSGLFVKPLLAASLQDLSRFLTEEKIACIQRAKAEFERISCEEDAERRFATRIGMPMTADREENFFVKRKIAKQFDAGKLNASERDIEYTKSDGKFMEVTIGEMERSSETKTSGEYVQNVPNKSILEEQERLRLIDDIKRSKQEFEEVARKERFYRSLQNLSGARPSIHCRTIGPFTDCD